MNDEWQTTDDGPGPSGVDRAVEPADDDRFDSLRELTVGRVRTNGVETHYVERGTGPPVVFVHGMAMNASQWEPQLAALADEFRVIAYDVRGHGHTGGSDLETYTMETYAADLEELLTVLGVERPVVCGLSMGGCIAQVYAATHPGNVAGLVLADTFPAAPLSLKERAVFANLRAIALLDRVVRYTTLNRVQTWVGDRLAPGVAGDGTTVQRVMERAPAISHEEFVKVARSVAAFPGSGFDGSRITVPTLVTYGQNTAATLKTLHERLAEELRNTEVTVDVVPDAGHASNLDAPSSFSDAVAAFARSVHAHRPSA